MDKALSAELDQCRLQTFATSPMLSDLGISLSNSPTKLAEAGFTHPQNAVADEVECRSCGAKYKNWSGESPLAVHRTLNPWCPFLNTAPETNVGDSSPQNEIENSGNESKSVKRQLFSMSEKPSIMNTPVIDLPFLPKQGGRMLFESQRLLTFQDPVSLDAAIYAEAGFVYSVSSKCVVCIVCDAELKYEPRNLSQLETLHEEICPQCPFVRLFDVGNISRDIERKIKEKVHMQYLYDILNNRFCNSRVRYVIRHPEFEKEADRRGTFSKWPKALACMFSSRVMAESGFYFTGFSDMVKCYTCGVGLYDWSPNVIPAEQHAKASPECTYMLQSRGKEFVDQAQHAEMIVKAHHEEAIPEVQAQDASSATTDSGVSSATSSSAATPLSTPSPMSSGGSPVLDLEAIKAATACGQYPNTDLLLGILKAADTNYERLCEKSQEVQVKEAENQAKQAEYQAKEAAYQQEIQATRSELQRTTFELQLRDVEVRTELEQQFIGQIRQQNEALQQKDEALQQKDEALQQKDETIQQKDHELQQNRQELEQKDQELEQNRQELDMKNMEIEDLKRHIRSLIASPGRSQGSTRSDENSLSSSSSDMEHSIESDSTLDEFPIASCKVCLVKPSQIVFLPCKHLCCCDKCAARLHGQNCPICREQNLGFEKVYVV